MVVYVSVIDIEKRMEERIVIMCVLLIEASYLFLSVISQFTIKGTTDVLNYIIQFILWLRRRFEWKSWVSQ